MDKSTLTTAIKRFALDNGFDLVGVGPARLAEEKHEASYRRWLEDGFHGGMDYMARDPQRRADPSKSLEGARSVVSLALNYYHKPEPRPEGAFGKVSKYAHGTDYHKVIEKKLKALARFIREELGGQAKTYVDTGPLLERAFAQAAGLGFIGKSTNLITRNFGSWVFLASVITDLELEHDAPSTASCGTCKLCIDACPTQAIVESGRVDARKCISYLTIESKEEIPADLQSKVGEWVFGCDICQDVCPYNHRAKETSEPNFLQPIANTFLSLPMIDALATDEEFSKRFSGSPLKRTKRSGLMRNARVVKENLESREARRSSAGH